MGIHRRPTKGTVFISMVYFLRFLLRYMFLVNYYFLFFYWKFYFGCILALKAMCMVWFLSNTYKPRNGYKNFYKDPNWCSWWFHGYRSSVLPCCTLKCANFMWFICRTTSLYIVCIHHILFWTNFNINQWSIHSSISWVLVGYIAFLQFRQRCCGASYAVNIFWWHVNYSQVSKWYINTGYNMLHRHPWSLHATVCAGGMREIGNLACFSAIQ